MLLIYPPFTKACEPPGGLPLLGGVLKAHGQPYKILDLNCEFQNHLLDSYFIGHPSKKNYLDILTSKKGYSNLDRYKRGVSEVNRALSHISGGEASLGNYSSKEYDPLNSSDLERIQREYKNTLFYSYYKNRLSEELKGIHSVGISIQFINQVVGAFSLIGYIKENFPGVKIILGGGLVTSWNYKANVDRVVKGRGEYELLDFLGIKPDKDKIDRVIPDYSFTKSLNYFSPGFILPVANSYGCSWKKCSFCPEVAENSPYIEFEIKKSLNKINKLERLYSPELIHILDNEINPTLLKSLSNKPLKTPWYGFTRFYKVLTDLDFCKRLKESGCLMLKLGLESGDQDVLNSLNKGISLKQASIILGNLEEAGIKTFIYILLGTPVEDRDAALKTKKFLLDHSSAITYLNLAIFNMPKFSSLGEGLDTYNLSDGDLSLYIGFKHPKGWDRRSIRKFIKEEYEKDSTLSTIIQRTPPQFGANHGALLNRLF